MVGMRSLNCYFYGVIVTTQHFGSYGSSKKPTSSPLGHYTMISILIATKGAYCCFFEEIHVEDRLFGNQFGALVSHIQEVADVSKWFLKGMKH